ncbi:MAG: nitronate monooxygenase [Hyphomicrobiaceae bacterium]|nr:nitronate monooxygenase [Hyphomicrobiaceae bacterium]
MRSPLCKRFGIDFPLFAFTHCRDVVVEVTNAGGFGVLGAVAHTPETLEIDLAWIDARIKGPYGVDLLIPSRMEDKEGALTSEELAERVPPSHRRHVADLLEKHGIDSSDLWTSNWAHDYSDNMREGGAQKLLDVAFGHPIKLFVNALGPPPKSVVDRCRAQGIAVGALTGAREHAMKNVAAGVDILVVSGTEAGGHCGEISTMVVVPDVLDAIKDHPDVHVLAAGGIATGRQMAAVMAMGAAGAWTGSVWLTTVEAETIPTVKAKMLKASARDTVRSRSRTGKPTRQLKSPWTEAWSGPDNPEPLEMPLQGLVSRPALAKVDKLAEAGHKGAKELATYYVGQAVGLMKHELRARDVVYEFKRDFAEAVERLSGTLED